MNELTQQLTAEFKAYEAALNGQAGTALHQRRRQAFGAFEQLGIPTTRHEEWKYSNLKPLMAEHFNWNAPSDFSPQEAEDLQIPDLEGNILYFVNGNYRPDLSTIVSPREQLELLPLAEAFCSHAPVVEEHFARYVPTDNNAFSALNTAFARDGVLLHVPAGQVVEQPVILRFVSDARHGAVASQKVAHGAQDDESVIAHPAPGPPADEGEDPQDEHSREGRPSGEGSAADE